MKRTKTREKTKTKKKTTTRKKTRTKNKTKHPQSFEDLPQLLFTLTNLFRCKQQERATVLCRRGTFALRARGEWERGRGAGQVERYFYSPITSFPPIHTTFISIICLGTCFFIPRYSTHKYVVTIHSLQHAGLFYRSMFTEIILLQKATVVQARTEVTLQLAVWAAQWERREGTASRTCRAGRSLTRSTTVSIQLFIGSQKVSKSAKKNL